MKKLFFILLFLSNIAQAGVTDLSHWTLFYKTASETVYIDTEIEYWDGGRTTWIRTDFNETLHGVIRKFTKHDVVCSSKQIRRISYILLNSSGDILASKNEGNIVPENVISGTQNDIILKSLC